jgi:hypothetical protein
VRIVAYKDPYWTGKIVKVSVGMPDSGDFALVRLDGVYYGNRLTGRVIGAPRVRWYFDGPEAMAGKPGLPPWCEIVCQPCNGEGWVSVPDGGAFFGMSTERCKACAGSGKVKTDG